MAAAVVIWSLKICSHFREGQVAGDHDRAALVALGQEREEDLHLRHLDIAGDAPQPRLDVYDRCQAIDSLRLLMISTVSTTSPLGKRVTLLPSPQAE